jgi:hypothetical protein
MEKHKPTVAVDLDGVLAIYTTWKGVDHIGDPIPGSIELTMHLKQFARVIIFTTRCCADPSLNREGLTPEELKAKVTHWLDSKGYFYDDVYTGQGKPIAAAYIDDRAVSCRPQEDTDAFTNTLKQTRYLVLGN